MVELHQLNKSDNNLEQCIKCTICTVYCPVSAVNPVFPGPKQAGPDGERMRLKGSIFYDESLKYCLNCKRCEVACPSDVRIGDIIQSARIKYNKKRPKVRDFILAGTDLTGSLTTPFAPLVNTFLGLKATKSILDLTLKIDRHRTFPEYSSGTFERWYGKNAAAQKNFDKQVSYFHGCYVNYNNPQLGIDLIKVFNSLGIGVQLLEKEKCCGVALISNGFIRQAKKQAKVNIESIRKSVFGNKMPVVATSSSCTFTIRDEYPHLLNIENYDVRNSVELATRYIYRFLSNEDIKLNVKKETVKVAYHTPCHLEKLGWAYYSIELLKLIPNIELTILNNQCCGIAGTYGFKKENYKTAQDIGLSLFEQIEADNYDCIVTDCETCKWQIEMSTTKKCKHPISVLATALE
jgi:glycerol-3-phosphate dehydrogenase subunit C